MPLIPIATFLAGSLLSLLLPVALLIGLVVWYLRAVKHVPEGSAEPQQSSAPPSTDPPASATPGSTVPGSS